MLLLFRLLLLLHHTNYSVSIFNLFFAARSIIDRRETIENKLLRSIKKRGFPAPPKKRTRQIHYKYCSEAKRRKKRAEENSIYIRSRAACRLSIKQQEEMEFLHCCASACIGKQWGLSSLPNVTAADRYAIYRAFETKEGGTARGKYKYRGDINMRTSCGIDTSKLGIFGNDGGHPHRQCIHRQVNIRITGCHAVFYTFFANLKVIITAMKKYVYFLKTV